MLLNNNNNADDVPGVTRRRPKSQQGRRVRDKTTTTARNSWSFAENLEESWKNLEASAAVYGEVKAAAAGVARSSRVRQRSNGNLMAANATRSRDHSNHKQGLGTVSKGVDYIRLQGPVVARKSPVSSSETQSSDSEIHDRSTYGNPDGQSTHSTAEREAPAASADNGKATFVRTASGRSSARERFRLMSVSKNGRKSDEKTEWTFVAPNGTNHETPVPKIAEESSVVRKGLLWVMRDRLFSRWHERFCLLTNNYLHCFKKASEAAGATQMGAFLFKVNLAEVNAVQWLDKKGTAIVCLNFVKEGRLLVKTSHDLIGWYAAVQDCIRDTQGRRQTLLERRTVSPAADRISKPDQVVNRLKEVSVNTNKESLICRDNNAVARIRQQQHNRFSLLTEIEVKLAENSSSSSRTEMTEPQSLFFLPEQQPEQQQQQQQQQHQLSKPAAIISFPVPVPYRERSSSFDRTRGTKAERDVKRRSYFHNQGTQV